MKKIKMRWYSFSSNKSQLIVSRITHPEPGAPANSADRVGRPGGCLLVLQQGSAGDAAGKLSVRCKEELPG